VLRQHALQSMTRLKRRGKIGYTGSSRVSVRAAICAGIGVSIVPRSSLFPGMLMEQLQRAASELRERRQAPRGVLRVSATVGFGRHCIVPLLPDFARLYPDIELDLPLDDGMADVVEDRYCSTICARIVGIGCYSSSAHTFPTASGSSWISCASASGLSNLTR